ncbi:MAG: ATPase, T2SS/T4P/T4SS family [Planctomycetota bacterium]
MAKFDRKLRDILLKHSLLTEEQGNQALQTAEQEGKSLSAVLTEKGIVGEKDIIASVSAEMRIPPIDLNKVQFIPNVIDSLPEERAKQFGVLPIARIGNILTVAVANPFDILKLDDVQLITKCELRPVISTDVAIESAIQRAYNPGEQAMEDLLSSELEEDVEEVVDAEDQELNLASIEAGASESPVVKLVNLIIIKALQSKVSDIHIEPFPKQIRVRYRQDGILHETIKPPKKMQNALISRLKIMSAMDIAENARPQDGKIQLRFEGRQIDFRVSILPVVHGEKCVMRILDSSNLTLQLDSMGWEPRTLDQFRKAIGSPWGMILITGPTGSGKSTTLYSGLREILSVEDNLVTVEEPVEYQLDGINQVQVSTKRGLTFAAALRSILRQSPDKIMVGETRDLETAEIAIQASLTGHLVLTTLHTNDAPSAMTRLVDMGIDPFMVASSVILVLAQRLCRKLCEICKNEAQVPKDRLLALGFTEEEADTAKIFKAHECGKCAAGYKGRFAVVESFPLTEEIRRLILDGGSALDLKRKAVDDGMITLRRCAILNAMRGKTSLEEMVRVTIAD